VVASFFRKLVSISVHSWLIPLLFAEFLEGEIAAQGVPSRIEPKIGRRNGYAASDYLTVISFAGVGVGVGVVLLLESLSRKA
jgi:hypothetical protein